MNKPTQQNLDTTLETLEWWKDYLEKNEPQATNDRNALNQVIDSFPYELEELDL